MTLSEFNNFSGLRNPFSDQYRALLEEMAGTVYRLDKLFRTMQQKVQENDPRIVGGRTGEPVLGRIVWEPGTGPELVSGATYRWKYRWRLVSFAASGQTLPPIDTLTTNDESVDFTDNLRALNLAEWNNTTSVVMYGQGLFFNIDNECSDQCNNSNFEIGPVFEDSIVRMTPVPYLYDINGDGTVVQVRTQWFFEAANPAENVSCGL